MVTITQYFDVLTGSNLELVNKELEPNGINFVARTSKDNGVVARIKRIPDIEPNPPNTISVAVSGSVMESFLQKEPYYSSFHLFILKPKITLTDKQLLFYCMCLRANRHRYNYGRQADKTLHTLSIPSIDEIPEWVETVSMPAIPKSDSVLDKVTDLNVGDWKYYQLSDLFEISGSKITPLLRLRGYGEGVYPYVTTQATNNGVAGFYNYFTETGNILTVDSAVLGYCSYQSLNFSASDHVEKLTPKFSMNQYVATFLTTVINLEQYRYSYGRKASQGRLRQTRIKLPSKGAKPDWQFMEDYIKSLPYSSSL